jgi:hypothetical protein
MIELAQRLFNTFVKINGEQKKIVCLRGYVLGQKDVLVMTEYQKIEK